MADAERARPCRQTELRDTELISPDGVGFDSLDERRLTGSCSVVDAGTLDFAGQANSQVLTDGPPTSIFITIFLSKLPKVSVAELANALWRAGKAADFAARGRGR